jgi:subtilisin family serine protease
MKKFSVFLLGILLSLNFQMNHFHTKSNDGNRNLTKLEKIFKKNIPNTITKSRINQPVEENGLVSTGGWHLDEINIKDAQDMYFTGKGVNVAVIDSGITNNIELNIYKKVNCYVASGNNTNCNENFSFEDSFVNSETGIPGH